MFTCERSNAWNFMAIAMVVIVATIAAPHSQAKVESGDLHNSQLPKNVSVIEAILPPQAVLSGKRLGDWGGDWWKWAFSFRREDSPISDTTGALCSVGQSRSNDIWFLAGSFSSEPIVRDCIVPRGKTLFFPIINVIHYSPKDRTLSCVGVKKLASDKTRIPIGLFVRLDGVALANPELHQEASTECFDPFEISGDAKNRSWGYPAASNGFWIALSPLSTGDHLLQFGGELPSFGQNITYKLHVLPVKEAHVKPTAIEEADTGDLRRCLDLKSNIEIAKCAGANSKNKTRAQSTKSKSSQTTDEMKDTNASSVSNKQLGKRDQKIYDDALQLINQYNGEGNHLEKANELLTDLATRNPASGYPYAGLADLQYRLAGMGYGDFAAANELAMRAIGLDAEISDAYVVIAKVMIEEGNLSAARAAAEKSIALTPTKPEAMFAMARVAETAHRYEESQMWYRKAISTYKDNIRKANIYAWLGSMLSSKVPADVTGATEAYTRAAELNFESGPWMLNNIGWYLITNTDHYDQAARYFTQALKIMDFGAAREGLGLSEYYRWGDSIQHPEKYRNTGTQLLTPDVLSAKTGISPEYAFVKSAGVRSEPVAAISLLQKGFVKNVDVTPSDQSTALISAVLRNHLALAKLLISREANVNAEVEGAKTTAIFYAVSNSNIELVKLLVDKGARINLVDSGGYSLGTYALLQKSGKPGSILKYLLENGLDSSIPDKQGSTLIVNAVLANDVDAVRILLEKNPDDVEAKYYGKSTILNLASTGASGPKYANDAKRKAIVVLLLNAGANPWFRDPDADMVTKLMLGAPVDKEIAKMLIEARKRFPKPKDFGEEYKG